MIWKSLFYSSDKKMRLIPQDVIYIIIVSILWGGTNPFIRQASKGLKEVQHGSTSSLQFLNEIMYLLSNWKYSLPFMLNQSGSIFYNILVAKLDLSVAVPVVNSLTFLVTILVGMLLNEPISRMKVFGTALVVAGVSLCVFDKLW